nr:MAG TPA: hypothetical protein [Caudoviricetes sp.]
MPQILSKSLLLAALQELEYLLYSLPIVLILNYLSDFLDYLLL